MSKASSKERSGRVCWVDLATADEQLAKTFYCRLFRWSVEDRVAASGRFSAFGCAGEPVASMYQLNRAQLAGGVPSHWTAYVAVPDVDLAATDAERLGGRIVAPPQTVGGIARIGLIADPTGALVGLWQTSGPQRA